VPEVDVTVSLVPPVEFVTTVAPVSQVETVAVVPVLFELPTAELSFVCPVSVAVVPPLEFVEPVVPVTVEPVVAVSLGPEPVEPELTDEPDVVLDVGTCV
jgi:hypothetical protein